MQLYNYVNPPCRPCVQVQQNRIDNLNDKVEALQTAICGNMVKLGITSLSWSRVRSKIVIRPSNNVRFWLNNGDLTAFGLVAKRGRF